MSLDGNVLRSYAVLGRSIDFVSFAFIVPLLLLLLPLLFVPPSVIVTIAGIGFSSTRLGRRG